MIPYLAHPVWHIGPFTVHAFGVAVAAALVTGYVLVLRRSASAGISSMQAGRIFAAVTVVGLAAGRLWNGQGGMSGTGLAAGAIVCMLTCAAFCPFWPTLDLFAYAVPFTLAIGRVGCFFAHDHLGRPSDSWLAVRFPDGPRYDLGLLYALAAGAAAVAVFFVARLSPRPGVITGLVLLLVAIGRLGVLSLGQPKPSDVWFGIAAVAAGVVLLISRSFLRIPANSPTKNGISRR